MVDAVAAAVAAASGADPDDTIFSPSASEVAAGGRAEAAVGGRAHGSPTPRRQARALFASASPPVPFFAGRPTTSRADSVQSMASLRQGAERTRGEELADAPSPSMYGGNQTQFL